MSTPTPTREPVEEREDTDDTPRWALAPGVQTLGPVRGSGLVQTSYLVAREDGQMLQISELLHAVLRAADPDRPPASLAAAVSAATGRTLTVEGLDHLARTKLEPMGLLVDAAAPPAAHAPPPRRARPVLALSLKATLLPAPVVRRLARALSFLFWTPLVVAAVGALVILDVVLARSIDPIATLGVVLMTPELLLALFVLLTLGALIHECGHAAACAAGGVSPGAIGMGVYILFPAFYTDVTESYRLDRVGRLRTDLGGLYFNVWCLLAAGGGYLVTGQPVLLLVVLLMHVEMAQQLVPTVRFDGYFVLSDLAGVPDPFSRVLPVLRSLGPGRPDDPRVAELRPRARRLITGWVLVVVPTLVLGLGWLVWNLPDIVRTSVLGVSAQVQHLADAWARRDVVSGILAALAVVLLAVPLLGLAVVLPRLVLAPVRRLARRRVSTTSTTAPNGTTMLESPPTAAAFTDELMLASRRHAATRGWRRLLTRLSRGRIVLGPGRAEQEEDALVERVRRPVAGTRRIVVMSRKGGVGKTSVTLLLGATTATLRGDRVVAIDANPDAGNLAHRVGNGGGSSITDVLRDPAAIDSYARLRMHTAQTAETPLEVLASDDDARISTALTDADYHEVVDLLDRFYNIVMIDTGTGILDSANQGLIAEADQLVVVLPPALDGGRAAALTLDWLDEHGHEDLVRSAVVVVNGVRRGAGLSADTVTPHFAARCRRVCLLPWDAALEPGGRTTLASLHPRTRRALLELAAVVVDGLDTPRRSTSTPPGTGATGTGATGPGHPDPVAIEAGSPQAVPFPNGIAVAMDGTTRRSSPS